MGHEVRQDMPAHAAVLYSTVSGEVGTNRRVRFILYPNRDRGRHTMLAGDAMSGEASRDGVHPFHHVVRRRDTRSCRRV
jgi:hypothetical protein